jgi:hypothetical protein
LRWLKLKNRERILLILEYLLSHGREIKVRIEGKEYEYSSKILEIMPGSHGMDIPKSVNKRTDLVVEKLVPEEGNTLIQQNPEIDLEFFINTYLCRCHAHYIGISNFYPCYGLIVSLPVLVELQEKRIEERIMLSYPEYICALLKVGLGDQKDQLYELNVLNCSSHGLGLLVTEKNFDLLHVINPGDKIPEIILFAESSLTHLDGTVRHKTKIKDGKYTGNYLLGIESNTILKDAYELPCC